MKWTLLLALLLPAVLLGPGCRGEREDDDTRGRGGNVLEGTGLEGSVRLHVAEALRPVVDRHVTLFRRNYPRAEFALTTTNTREAYVALVRGQADAVVVDRPPNAEEQRALAAAGVDPAEVVLGQGALVAAVHPTNPARMLGMDALRRAAAGQPVQWAEVGGSGGAVRLALPPLTTGVVELLTRQLLPPDSLPRPTYAAADEADALRWVSENPAGLTIVSLAAYEGVSEDQVRAIAVPDSAGAPVLPAPLRVYANHYPLRHPILLVVGRSAGVVGASFASFVLGTQGQEAVQRAGLVPARLPVREIELQ